MTHRCIILFALALACSSESMPPPMRDDDTADASSTPSALDLCATPAPGCPCADAGEEIDCGLVYRISGSHVDCAPGTMTCGDDGGWGACIGPSVYDGSR
jgi:hypothetical protein